MVWTHPRTLSESSTSDAERATTLGELHETVAEHIARVAADLFAHQGFDATAVREIVEAAEVTKPTLYYYYGSKMGLAEALLTRPLETLCSTLEAVVRDEPDPVRVLVRLIESHFRFCREAPNRARLAYAVLFGPSDSSLAGMLMPYAERFDVLWQGAVSRLVAVGSIPDNADTREGLSAALRGLVVIHTVDYLYRDRPLADDLPDRLVGQLLQGFSGRVPSGAQASGDSHV